jgi:hypothetical protein
MGVPYQDGGGAAAQGFHLEVVAVDALFDVYCEIQVAQ